MNIRHHRKSGDIAYLADLNKLTNPLCSVNRSVYIYILVGGYWNIWITFHILGMSSSQLTFIFFREVGLKHHTDIYIYHLLLCTGWPRHGHMHIIQIMQQASGQRPEINHQVVKTTSDSDQNSCSFRFQSSFSWPLPLQLDFKHIDIGITWPLCVAHFDLFLVGCRNQNDGGGGVLSV